MSLKGNKGEWSEIYALFKILGETKLYSGDADLNKIESHFYPVVKILRQELDKNFEYSIDRDLVIITGGESEIRLSVSVFLEKALDLFNRIRKGKGSLEFPDIEEFMKSINCKTLKAKSSDKTDIKIVIHDLRTGFQPLLGFSIKSKLGSESTLFNASGQSNFIYKIKNFKSEKLEEINSTYFFYDKFLKLKEIGATVEFYEFQSKTLKNNLIYIDSALDKILPHLVLEFYSTHTSKLSDLVQILANQNPIGFDITSKQDYYAHKIKRFLTEVALGMRSSIPWNGIYEANGGYIIIKKDGDIVCYHIYDKNQFEDYLFYHQKLETPDPDKHKFGTIYNEDGEYYIKLNLQTRFC